MTQRKLIPDEEFERAWDRLFARDPPLPDIPAAVPRSSYPFKIETVASFLEFFRPRTGLMQGLRGPCAIGRLLIPLHVQGDTLANVFSRPH